MTTAHDMSDRVPKHAGFPYFAAVLFGIVLQGHSRAHSSAAISA